MTIALPHRLWFIRHGETDYNREGRLQGQRDVPLNPKGREQARAVGRALRKLAAPEIKKLDAAHAFLASPLLRTRQTMELARAAMGLGPSDYTLCDDLKELTFGDWEGLTWAEVEARDGDNAAARAADKWDFTPPSGESYAALASRLAVWVRSVDRDLFVASHGGVARALMFLLAGVAPSLAAEANIHQGRALLFADGGFRWIG
ncbi:MAG TPA: histidine phosphatase family protein [Roseiarcus sp.]|nr:histidine phosphatase family protein [Roseiarcus sp.]